jgi:hypothetical protein
MWLDAQRLQVVAHIGSGTAFFSQQPFHHDVLGLS